MEVKQEGGVAFAYLDVTLDPGEEIVAESDAMSSMSTNIDMRSQLNGGFFGGLMRKYFGNESLFINTFTNTSSEVGKLTLVQPYPGDMRCVELRGQTFFLQPGAFVACTKNVKIELKWAGIASYIGGEGLFRIAVSGVGKVWYGAYGALLDRELDGETIIDSSHLVSYDKGIDLHIQLSGGLISSFTSGEGLVTRISGKGKYVVQSRSLESLGKWLSPKF